MSASPPKDPEVEAGVQSQSSDEMEREQAESSQQPSGFDFEVKEQDRWLPIANGLFNQFPPLTALFYPYALWISILFILLLQATPPLAARPYTIPSHETDTNTYLLLLVARIMKTALPDNAKIAKEAKECMQECVSEFISFITSEGTMALHKFIDHNY